MSSNWNLIDHIKRTSLIQGSPVSTNAKPKADGSLERYSNYAKNSRTQLSFHNINGTDVPAMKNAMVAGIVGSGINIQCRTDNDNINKSFEDLMSEHAEVEHFEVTGRFHRDEGFRQIVGFENLQGGVLIRHHYNTVWKIPYRIELIGVDMIDTSKTDTFNNTLNGLIKDKYGRITSVYLYTDSEKRVSRPFNMKNMTYYSTTWIDLSQYTAVSRMASILPTLDGILQYSSAEVQSALERAKAGHYWHTELYAPLLEALKDEFKNAEAEDSEKIQEATELLSRLASAGISAHGATPTPLDDKITVVDNKTDSVYDTLTNQSQKAMASAVGGSQVSVYKDIEKGNYSSIKGAISFDEEHYKIEFDKLQNIVIQDYLVRLFRVGVQIGRVSLARSKYFTNPRKYHNFDIMRQSKRVIDEAKDATATAKRLEAGTDTKNRIYAEKGLDYVSEVSKQIKIDVEVEVMKKKIYEANGLVYIQTGIENSNTTESKPEEDEDEK